LEGPGIDLLEKATDSVIRYFSSAPELLLKIRLKINDFVYLQVMNSKVCPSHAEVFGGGSTFIS